MSPAPAIFFKEVRELLRAPRTLLFAFALPLLLYPLLFLAGTALPRAEANRLREETLQVGAQEGFSVLGDTLVKSDRLKLVRIERGAAEKALRDGTIAAWLEVHLESATGPLRGELLYLETSESSLEARRRLRAVLKRASDALLRLRLQAHGLDLDPRTLVDVRAIDVSTPEARAGALAAAWLPFLLVLVLIAGGAFAALDLLAGEKERGTLETLAVQGIRRSDIAKGKFAVVFAAALTAGLLNVLGFLAAWSLGWVDTSGGGAAPPPPLGRFAAALVFCVPLAALVAGMLLALSAFAKSYREAQTYVVPLTLAALVPVGIAASPDVELGPVTALLPLANSALAIRGVLEGSAAPLDAFLVFAASGVYALVAVAYAAALLAREEYLFAGEPAIRPGEAEAVRRERRGLALGALALLLVYFGAGWLQSGRYVPRPVGLLLTLWVVVAGPALLYAVFVHGRPRELLALRSVRPAALAASACMGVGAAICLAAYMELQDLVLPLPEEVRRAYAEFFGGMEPAFAFFLVCVSPAVCEELLWRGAVQGELEARGRRLRAAVLTGLFFGLFHLDLYRFLPTALLGVVLARVKQRARSLFAPMLLHGVYNATALFVLAPAAENENGGMLARPGWVVSAALVFLVGYGLLYCETGSLRRFRSR